MASPHSDAEVSTNKPKNGSEILEFFMMLGNLKHLPRTGWVDNGIRNCESVAGHMYRMSLMAFFLGKTREQPLDREKCIRMALVHDMAECIVGDLTPSCGISKEEKHRQESEAMDKMCSLIDSEVKTEMLQLYKEYTEQVTPEAKAVKDLDRFDMILQAWEYEKESPEKSLQQFFDHTEGLFTCSDVIKWVEELKKIRTGDQCSESSLMS